MSSVLEHCRLNDIWGEKVSEKKEKQVIFVLMSSLISCSMHNEI